MKQIVCSPLTSRIFVEEVCTNTGLVICYLVNQPYKLHKIGHNWAFVGFCNSNHIAHPPHTSAREAMLGVLQHTPELLIFDSFEEFIAYHPNR